MIMIALCVLLPAGEAVFNGNCAACHAGGNNVIQNEKTLRKEALDQYLAGGLKEASIVTQVTNGKNAMPAFGGRLGKPPLPSLPLIYLLLSESVLSTSLRCF